MRTCRDAAYSPADWPSVDATLIYAGGDTPNPWTAPGLPPYADTRYAVPAWVRSGPTAASFDADGHAMIAWLHARNAPAGILTMLDLETARDAGYVMGYGATLHSAGYKVSPYGSTSTLFDNPPLDGYWPSDPVDPPQEHLYAHPGVIATQWGYFGSYNLSAITEGVTLWEIRSDPPDPTGLEGDPVYYILETTDTGNAFLVEFKLGGLHKTYIPDPVALGEFGKTLVVEKWTSVFAASIPSVGPGPTS